MVTQEQIDAQRSARVVIGNSVAVKPSETASLTLLRMVDQAHEAGRPDGVLNIITGDGITAGNALAHSMDVDILVFIQELFSVPGLASSLSP